MSRVNQVSGGSATGGGTPGPEGTNNTASGTDAHAEGTGTTASGTSAHAEGSHTTASGEGSHAEGWYSNAAQDRSHAEGSGTASNYYAHAEGADTSASGNASHAEGAMSTAAGMASHAEGTSTQANATSSHSEGQNTHADGQFSHAEGFGTHANGMFAHSEGDATIANADGSHSEGAFSEARGYYSSAGGLNALAEYRSQWVRSGGYFDTAGDAQYGFLQLFNETHDATPTLLFLNGAGSGLNTNPTVDATVLKPKAFHAYRLRAEVIAKATNANTFAGFTVTGVIARNASNPPRLVGSVTTDRTADAAAAAWDVTFEPVQDDDFGAYIAVRVTGAAGIAIRWVAWLQIVEVG